MNKRELIKQIIVETVRRNLQEMPRMAEMFTLADSWEALATEFEQANAGKRTTGFNRVKAGLESLAHKNFLTSNDLMQAFGYNSRQSINREFIPALKQAGILIPLRGGVMPTQQVDTDTEEDDEFNISDLPDNELTQAIDKDLAFKRIKVDPKAKRVEITQVKKFKVNGQFTEDFEYVYLEKKKTYTTSVFKFLKPYVENKYSQKLSPEGITLDLSSYWDTSQRKNIGELFPQQGDFVKYMKENLPKWRSNPISTSIKYKRQNYNWEQTYTPAFFEKQFGEISNIDKMPFETNYIVSLTR